MYVIYIYIYISLVVRLCTAEGSMGTAQSADSRLAGPGVSDSDLKA